jgi:hypothetical protein
MQPPNYPRTSFKQNLHRCLTPEEQDLSGQLWCQLMTGNLKAANRALEIAAPRVRDAVKTAIRMRNEDGCDHENPFL